MIFKLFIGSGTGRNEKTQTINESIAQLKRHAANDNNNEGCEISIPFNDGPRREYPFLFISSYKGTFSTAWIGPFWFDYRLVDSCVEHGKT